VQPRSDARPQLHGARRRIGTGRIAASKTKTRATETTATKPSGKLVEVLPGWSGRGEGGVYAILPPGRLVPTKTRLFVDEIANSIKVGWARKKRS
jgi:DNA-binding transcriptional LysR family regulator